MDKKKNKYMAMRKEIGIVVFVGDEIFAETIKDAEDIANERGYKFDEVLIYRKDV
mgnify:CR=1 FL=1